MIPMLSFLSNSFNFSLPKTFLGDELENKWNWILSSYNLPFESITDYLSYTITGITIPGFEIETVQQIGNLGKQKDYTVPKQRSDGFGSRDVSLTFQMKDGLLNYFIVMDFLFGKNEYKINNNYSGNLVISVRDSLGLRISKIYLTDFVCKGTDGITFSKTDNANNDNTFTLNCGFVYIEFDFEENDIEKITL